MVLDHARDQMSSWIAERAVISFFDDLSHDRITDAFSIVSDDLKWWGPGNVLLNTDKRRMMARLAASTNKGTVFEPLEMIAGERAVAVKV